MTETPNIQPSDIKPPRIKPPHRNRRLAWVALIGVLLAAGMSLLFSALGENTQFFYNPSDVVKTGFQPASNPFRIGGRVVEGSVEQGPGLLTKFSVTDFEREMPAPIEVRYQGVLPDLFREGQGVIISGELTSRFNFIGQEVLAKHDENYQPKIDYQDENKS